VAAGHGHSARELELLGMAAGSPGLGGWEPGARGKVALGRAAAP
jgi:hypothetical protein